MSEKTFNKKFTNMSRNNFLPPFVTSLFCFIITLNLSRCIQAVCVFSLITESLSPLNWVMVWSLVCVLLYTQTIKEFTKVKEVQRMSV